MDVSIGIAFYCLYSGIKIGCLGVIYPESSLCIFELFLSVGIKCKGMQQAFSWDIFQNAHGPNAAKKLEMVNLTLGPSELGAAVTIHPVPPDLQQRVHDTITGFRSEFQHRIDIVRYGNNAVAP